MNSDMTSTIQKLLTLILESYYPPQGAYINTLNAAIINAAYGIEHQAMKGCF